MKKYLKKHIALFLVFALLLSFCSCGNDGKGDSQTGEDIVESNIKDSGEGEENISNPDSEPDDSTKDGEDGESETRGNDGQDETPNSSTPETMSESPSLTTPGETTEQPADTTQQPVQTTQQPVQTTQQPVETTPPVHTHSWRTGTTVQPDCTNGGYTVYNCSCGLSKNDSYTSPLGHNIGEWVTVKHPTETDKGQKIRTCSRCTYSESEDISPLGTPSDAMLREVFELVNQARVQAGLNPLKYRAEYEYLTDIRAVEANTLFSHTRPDGRDWYTVFDDNNIDYYTIGENLAIGQTSAEEVFNGWMNSEGHRKNIMNPLYEGIIMSKVPSTHEVYSQGYSWVQLFITQW